MVAAICYAWLLENRMRTNKEGVDGDGGTAAVVVPVMNMRRGKMWKQQQVAWLFHHVGVDTTALLFSDEVDLETLMMAKKLSILVVGQDILRTSGEVGSQCTIVTDNYCEDAYELLQIPILKKILLAGILLDTQNLNMSGTLSMTRDAEAVQLLSVGSTPNYQNALYYQCICFSYDQLTARKTVTNSFRYLTLKHPIFWSFSSVMQDQRDGSFFEALWHNYGKPPDEGGHDNGAPMEQRIPDREYNHEPVVQNADKNSNDVKITRTNKMSPKSAKPKSVPAQAPAAASEQAADAPCRKNTFFLAKWFGFGPK